MNASTGPLLHRPPLEAVLDGKLELHAVMDQDYALVFEIPGGDGVRFNFGIFDADMIGIDPGIGF